MTTEERLIFKGLRAREELLKQAAEELARDRKTACEYLAKRLQLPVGDLGGRIKLDAQRGLILEETPDEGAPA